MIPSRLLSGAALALSLALSAPPTAADDGAANALLIEAVTALQAAPRGEDQDARYEALKTAVAALDRIVAEHPTSDLAVQIVTGQTIGNVDPERLKGELQAMQALRDRRAAEAAKPFMAQRMEPLRRVAQVEACVAEFECFARLELDQIQRASRRSGMDEGGRYGVLAAALYMAGYRGANLAHVMAEAAGHGAPDRRPGYLRDLFAAMTVEEGIAATAPRVVAFVEQALGKPVGTPEVDDAANRVVAMIVRLQVAKNALGQLTAWADALQAAGVSVDGERGLARQIAFLRDEMPGEIDKRYPDLEPLEQITADAARPFLAAYERMADNMAAIDDPRLGEMIDRFAALDAKFPGPDGPAKRLLELYLATGREAEVLAWLDTIENLREPRYALQGAIGLALMSGSEAVRRKAVQVEAEIGPGLFDVRNYERQFNAREMRLLAAGMRAGLAK